MVIFHSSSIYSFHPLFIIIGGNVAKLKLCIVQDPTKADGNFSDPDKGNEPSWDDSWPLPQLSSGDWPSSSKVETWLFLRPPVTLWRSRLLLWFSRTPLLKHCATRHETYLTNFSSWRYVFFPSLRFFLSFLVSGGQERPGDDQLLLLLHNLFKCFIYNRCDR